MFVKTVHQIWLQGKKKLPKSYKENIEKCKKLNDNDHILWDHWKIRKLIKKHYRWLLELYDNYQFWVSKADLARYVILHRYGGFYIDVDIIPYQSFRDLIIMSKGKVLLEVIDNNLLTKLYNRIFVNNHFLYVPRPKNEFIYYILLKCFLNFPREVYSIKFFYILNTAGPMMLIEATEEMLDKVSLQKTSVFINYFKHLGAGSWIWGIKKFTDTQDVIFCSTFLIFMYLVYLSVESAN